MLKTFRFLSCQIFNLHKNCQNDAKFSTSENHIRSLFHQQAERKKNINLRCACVIKPSCIGLLPASTVVRGLILKGGPKFPVVYIPFLQRFFADSYGLASLFFISTCFQLQKVSVSLGNSVFWWYPTVRNWRAKIPVENILQNLVQNHHKTRLI